MKKLVSLILVIVAMVLAMTACAGYVNVNINVPGESSAPMTPSSPPAVDVQPTDRDTIFSHRGLWIRVSDAFIPNGQDMLWSSEEDTSIHIIDIDKTQMEEDYGITGPLKDVAKAHAKHYNIDGDVLKGDGDYYYILREDTSDYGEPFTILSAFLMNEDGEFFEVEFTCYSKAWSELQEVWTSYIDTIQFEEYDD